MSEFKEWAEAYEAAKARIARAEEAYRQVLIRIEKIEQLIDWRIGGY